MPIRWSAIKVSEAMDQVDALLDEAEPILEKAQAVATEAQSIPNLPQYMHGRLAGVKYGLKHTILGRREDVRAVRRAIPKGALEAERKQQRLGL